MEDVRLRLPRLVQQGVAARLCDVVRDTGDDSKDAEAVQSVAQLVPVVP